MRLGRIRLVHSISHRVNYRCVICIRIQYHGKKTIIDAIIQPISHITGYIIDAFRAY